MTGTRQAIGLQTKLSSPSLTLDIDFQLLGAASELPSKAPDLLLGSKEAVPTEYLRDFV